MSWFLKFVTSSVGRKFVTGLTGLFLVSFLIVHLTGNFSLFRADNGEAFNVYSHFMGHNPLIRVMEIGLVLGFGIHIFTAIYLQLENKKSRPIGYDKVDASANSSLFSRTMFLSGSVILFFLMVHLTNFFVPHRVTGKDVVDGTAVVNATKLDGSALLASDGQPIKDMYISVATAFKNPIYVAIYLLGLILLAFHLNHGFQSAFQTFGLNNKKYFPLIRFIGLILSIALPAGFASMPIYFYFILG